MKQEEVKSLILNRFEEILSYGTFDPFTLEHLLHGLQEIQAIASQLDAELLRQLLIAWIGHDVVYELGHAEVSNEVRSGRWVELFFGDCPAVQAVYGTEYTAENEPQDELCHLLCSIDLSIIGQKAGMFDIHPCLKAQDSSIMNRRTRRLTLQRAMSDPGSVERFLIA